MVADLGGGIGGDGGSRCQSAQKEAINEDNCAASAHGMKTILVIHVSRLPILVLTAKVENRVPESRRLFVVGEKSGD